MICITNENVFDLKPRPDEEKIRLKLNRELIKKLRAARLEMLERNGWSDMLSGFDKAIGIILKDMPGRRRVRDAQSAGFSGIFSFSRQ
jgi:hypothetical protein